MARYYYPEWNWCRVDLSTVDEFGEPERLPDELRGLKITVLADLTGVAQAPDHDSVGYWRVVDATVVPEGEQMTDTLVSRVRNNTNCTIEETYQTAPV